MTDLKLKGKKDCRTCEGKGFVFVPNGEEDSDQEVCVCVTQVNDDELTKALKDWAEAQVEFRIALQQLSEHLERITKGL